MSRTRKALYTYDSRKEILFLTKVNYVRFRKITELLDFKSTIFHKDIS
jgi:hypothetical protein